MAFAVNQVFSGFLFDSGLYLLSWVRLSSLPIGRPYLMNTERLGVDAAHQASSVQPLS